MEKKKQVEQHHAWKKRTRKNIPGGDYAEGKEGDGGDFLQAKFLSNHTHYSPTDPDARIATKPGKPRDMKYLGQLSVDTGNHVITGACADFADKRDSQCLEKIVDQTSENLHANDIEIEQIIADTGYSSGESLQYLEENNIDAYIPNFGQ